MLACHTDCVVSKLAPEASTAAVRASMKANHRRDTKPELRLRSALFALGYRYRVDLPLVAGGAHIRPDIVFTKRRVAVFVDGCFWHGCPDHCRRPKGHADYWHAKIEGNRARDARDTEALENSGWCVVRIWEHASLEEAISLVRTAARRGQESAQR